MRWCGVIRGRIQVVAGAPSPARGAVERVATRGANGDNARMRRIRAAALCWVVLASVAVRAEVAARVDGMGREFFVYGPAKVDRAKTYWLVVGVHGYGGNGAGAAGFADWAKRGDCVVVGPSFPNSGYQLLREQAGEQLVKLFDLLKKEYKLHDKMFLAGFSGGAQFAHRFVMKYPELVAGCAAHSAGSWATGEQWGAIDPKAADVPFVMSCGERDTERMAPGAPYTRIDWAKRFERQLAEGKFMYQVAWWPGVGHAQTDGARRMTEDCYLVATQVMPAAEKSFAAAEGAIEKKDYRGAIVAANGARRPVVKTASGLVQKVVGRNNGRAEEIVKRAKGLMGQGAP